MNEQKFIELLNLYVDHEITVEDAGRLEAEVMKNPKRRKIYDQYCRIQKACVLIAKSKGALEPEADPAVVVFSPVRSRSWASRLYTGGMVAAAACIVAAVVMRFSHVAPPAMTHSVDGSELAVAQSSPDLETVANLKPVFSNQPAPSFVDSETAPHLDWISQVRVMPVQRLQAADLVFGAKPADLKPADQPVQVQSSLQGPAEMTAFQIQE